MTEVRYLPDETATEALGAELCARLKPGHTVWLQGDLGAGKTTLVRGWLRALGHAGAVKSPTYTLVELYEFANFSLYHFDLYRIADPEELDFIGIRDYFRSDSLCLVEWPDRAPEMLPLPDLSIRLAAEGDGRRAELIWKERQS